MTAQCGERRQHVRFVGRGPLVRRQRGLGQRVRGAKATQLEEESSLGRGQPDAALTAVRRAQSTRADYGAERR